MLRRTDFEWCKIITEWSNYDLDALERDIQEEKRRRQTAPKKGFLVP